MNENWKTKILNYSVRVITKEALYIIVTIVIVFNSKEFFFNLNMQGTGKTYAVSGETTEWEDILINKGIRTKEEIYLEKGLNPADVSK